MSKATIKIEYVNQPKSLKGPGSVKDEQGVYYKVWTRAKNPDDATLSKFEAGKTYEVEFDTGEYNGKPDHTIRKILSVSESSNGSTTVNNLAVNDRSARIERQAALKVAVQMLKDDDTTQDLFALAAEIEAFIDQAGKPKEEEPEVEI